MNTERLILLRFIGFGSWTYLNFLFKKDTCVEVYEHKVTSDYFKVFKTNSKFNKNFFFLKVQYLRTHLVAACVIKLDDLALK